MAYTVLARRYRSTTFDEVVGQDHIAKTLKRAIETGRIAHAFLFCGTRGTGKTSSARILAKCLNCQSSDRPVTEPCGKCGSCQGIARGDDIDVIEIDAASNTGVDNVREIIENAQYRPARSRFKIYIIDEVHMLSKNAFNALLKTLEEPPEHVKFILATTEPEKVLPTILSRCQRYDFRNISTREIAEHLRQICKNEKIKANEDALLLVAKAGAGSMRDALSLLDRLLSIGEKELSVDLIEQLLGMPRGQAIFDLSQAVGTGEIKSALEQADALIKGGLSPDTLVTSLADHLRNLLILRTCGPDTELVDLPGIPLEDLNKQAAQFDPIVLSQDIAVLEELRRNLRLSGAGRALLDATLVRLTLADQFSSVGELLSSVEDDGTTPTQKKKPELTDESAARASVVKALAPVGGEEGLGAGLSVLETPTTINGHAQKSPSPQPAPTSTRAREVDSDDDDALPAVGKVWDNSGPSLSELLKQSEAATAVVDQPAASNVEAVDAASLPQVWNRLLVALQESSPSLPGLLQGAKLIGIDDGLATVRYPHDHATAVKILERNGKKETVCKALVALVQQPLALKLELEAPPLNTAVDEAKPVAARPKPRVEVKPAQPAEPARQKLSAEELDELKASNDLFRAVVDQLGIDGAWKM